MIYFDSDYMEGAHPQKDNEISVIQRFAIVQI